MHALAHSAALTMAEWQEASPLAGGRALAGVSTAAEGFMEEAVAGDSVQFAQK